MRYTRFLLVLATAVLSLGLAALHAESDVLTSQSSQRPHDPWVFRSVLDGRARMITVALHEKLWVAYDAQTNGLYRAWPGGVKFEGAVYNYAHGPQPTVDSDVVYYTQPRDSVWTLQRDGRPVGGTMRYRGYLLDGTESVTLRYTFEIDGQTVTVEETPGFLETDGRVGLAQRFNIQNLPQGMALVLAVGSDNSIDTKREVTGQAELAASDDPDQPTVLRLIGDGEATLIITWKANDR